MKSGSAHFSVLGADGFVGRALVRHLEAKGERVDIYGRDRSDYMSRPLGHAIYCIGLTADYLDRPFDTVEAHVSLFAHLLEKADFDSLTYLSSTRLYDSGDGNGRETASLVLDPRNPRHLYDFSKGLGESLCCTSARPNVRAARLSCVYAPDLEARNFLHETLHAALKGRPISLPVSPLGARDYVHIDDVCRALTAIARAGQRPIYNVASGANVENERLFKVMRDLTGCAITASGGPAVAAPPRIDVSALADDFGIRPVRLEDALPGIVAHHGNPPALEREAS